MTDNNSDGKDLNDCSQENLLNIIKEQNKQIKLLQKKLAKLEEKFIKTNTDFKMLQNDKANLESFLKIIFPKEMYEKLIKTELGLYDCSELNRFWVVVEGAKQNDYQKFVNQLKSENTDLNKRYETFKSELEIKTSDLEKLRALNKELENTSSSISSMYTEIAFKFENVDKEKNLILMMLEEKEKQIERLAVLEIENAELKAKNLLDNLDNKKDDLPKKKNNIFNLNPKTDKQLNITSISSGCQTSEKLFSSEYVAHLENEVADCHRRIELLKKEYHDYKERSNNILLSTEENYKKLLKEYEDAKYNVELLHKENSELVAHQKMVNSNSSSTDLRILNNIKNKTLEGSIGNTLKDQNISILNPNMSITEIEKQRISIEYLKNVLLKYLEAIAIGNEFQTKILENVIFAILNIPQVERIKLEEKRSRSSFYYNLWYNAKAFLSARIYGNGTQVTEMQPSLKLSDDQLEGSSERRGSIIEEQEMAQKRELINEYK